ncbi:hypothetical protein F4778DRAFT_738783 [Xylariomycetidae sp. FL2044]|nr:hypothetical protein F4778DRAFT_738783 [Xylariomycetidae sp. FL2044]
MLPTAVRASRGLLARPPALPLARCPVRQRPIASLAQHHLCSQFGRVKLSTEQYSQLRCHTTDQPAARPRKEIFKREESIPKEKGEGAGERSHYEDDQGSSVSFWLKFAALVGFIYGANYYRKNCLGARGLMRNLKKHHLYNGSVYEEPEDTLGEITSGGIPGWHPLLLGNHQSVMQRVTGVRKRITKVYVAVDAELTPEVIARIVEKGEVLPHEKGSGFDKDYTTYVEVLYRVWERLQGLEPRVDAKTMSAGVPVFIAFRESYVLGEYSSGKWRYVQHGRWKDRTVSEDVRGRWKGIRPRPERVGIHAYQTW